MLKIENILIAFYGTLTVAFFLFLIFIGIQGNQRALVFREISYFISPYAPKNAIAILLYQTYNLMLLLFSCLVSFRLYSYYAKIGAVCLSFVGLIGLLLIQFPMDPPESIQTVRGIQHIFLVMMMSLYIIVSMILFGYAFSKKEHMLRIAKISYAMSIILFVVSVFTGIIAVKNMPYVGIVEKIPIAVFLLWIVLVIIGIIEEDRRIKYISQP